MMVLLVLLADQSPYFLHLLVVLPDARLVAVLDLDHALGLLWLSSGVGLGRVVDGGLRFVFCLGVESGVCSDLAGVGKAVVAQSGLQHLPLFLFLQKLLPSLIAEGYQPMYAFGLCVLAIAFLLPLEQRLLELGVLIIVGMVELVHLIGGAMRVVPDEPFRLVKLTIFEELPGLRKGWMRQDGLEVVILNGGLAGVLHLSINLSSEVITNKRVGAYQMRLRGKSQLSLKFLYQSSLELWVIFFSTDRLISCSMTFYFHQRVPLYFQEIRMDSMKFYSSAMIELISSSQRKQFSTGSLGIVSPDFTRYSQKPQSLRLTSTVFCLLGINATSFFNRSGKVRFLPWLSSER